MSRLGVLVSGNGSNLQALIDACASGRIKGSVAVVISNRADAYALERASKAGIATQVLSHKAYPSREAFDAAIVEVLRRERVEWVLFAGFMRLVTPVLLDAFPDRVLNIHPSLLPAFPGVDAGRQAFEYGVKQTGCTVHLVTHEMDTGPIIAQTAVAVREDDSLDALMQRIHAAEHQTYVAVAAALCEGRIELDHSFTRARVRVRES